MSTIRATPGQPDQPQPQRDPFFYGWRDEVVKDSKGRHLVRHPLTREDVLHPQEGYCMPQNRYHDRDCDYLRDNIQFRTRQEPETLVAHDLLINWDLPGLRGHSPDLVVIRNVRPPHPVSSFNVAEHGVRPELIVEVTSPSTRDIDLDDKRREYWRAGVPVYVIVDEQIRDGQR